MLYYRYLLLFLALSVGLLCECQAQTDEEKMAEWQASLPGAHYFWHCKCYGHYMLPDSKPASDSGRRFPNDTPEHPKKPADLLWHHFMKQLIEANGKFSVLGEGSTNMARAFSDSGKSSDNVLLLPDYLKVIHVLRQRHEKTLPGDIAWNKKILNRPKDAEHLRNYLTAKNERVAIARRILDALPGELIPLYQNVLDHASKKAQDSFAMLYSAGIMNMARGDYPAALKKINRFIELAQVPACQKVLKSYVFQSQGESYFEIGRYHEAINALTEAIRRDPENKAAYMWRACAYFEGGHFDESLKDFLASGVSSKQYEVKLVSAEFLAAFTTSLGSGVVDGCVEFVPNLCHTACGLGRVLWDCVESPVESTKQFAGACSEAGEWLAEYSRTLDKEKIDGYVRELKELYTRFDELGDIEKGELLGYAVGKYGVDILGGAAIAEGALALKGMDKVKKLRDLNRVCTLEAMASSAAAEEKIIQAAVEHVAQREAYLQGGGWVLPKRGGVEINGRWYTEHALERMAPDTPQVRAMLEPRVLERARAKGYEPGTEKFGDWLNDGNKLDPRGIPPMLVEAEIANPGTTGITVVCNEHGDVITAYPGR